MYSLRGKAIDTPQHLVLHVVTVGQGCLFDDELFNV